MGHEDPTFTMKVYTQVPKHRGRLTAKEREAFERSVEWASTGTTAPVALEFSSYASLGMKRPALQGLL